MSRRALERFNHFKRELRLTFYTASVLTGKEVRNPRSGIIPPDYTLYTTPRHRCYRVNPLNSRGDFQVAEWRTELKHPNPPDAEVSEDPFDVTALVLQFNVDRCTFSVVEESLPKTRLPVPGGFPTDPLLAWDSPTWNDHIVCLVQVGFCVLSLVAMSVRKPVGPPRQDSSVYGLRYSRVGGSSGGCCECNHPAPAEGDSWTLA